jgi:hypothetical protein
MYATIYYDTGNQRACVCFCPTLTACERAEAIYNGSPPFEADPWELCEAPGEAWQAIRRIAAGKNSHAWLKAEMDDGGAV